MCGIHCIISDRRQPPLDGLLLERLRSRGPDHLGTAETSIPVTHVSSTFGSEPCLFASFTASVLALRGTGITEQPFLDGEDGSVFCWNGEAWQVGGSPVQGNDGNIIHKLLSLAETHDAILDVLRSIEGPFAFLYLNKRDPVTLYFGRDRLGRRSLLKLSDPHRLSLCSVADSSVDAWSEVEADGIYAVNLDGCIADARFSRVSKYDWLPDTKDYVRALMQTHTYVISAEARVTLSEAYYIRSWVWEN
jgi:asparagine synthetase B (glutamine-hydrolysing)